MGDCSLTSTCGKKKFESAARARTYTNRRNTMENKTIGELQAILRAAGQGAAAENANSKEELIALANAVAVGGGGGGGGGYAAPVITTASYPMIPPAAGEEKGMRRAVWDDVKRETGWPGMRDLDPKTPPSFFS